MLQTNQYSFPIYSSEEKQSESPEKKATPAAEESDEIKRRRLIYNKIKELNMQEGNQF